MLTVELIKELLPKAQAIAEECTGEKCYPVKSIRIAPAHSYWAQVKKIARGVNQFDLSVSSLLFGPIFEKNQEVGEKELLWTLVHECLHCMPDGHGHGREFQRRAAKINEKYPEANIKRVNSTVDRYASVGVVASDVKTSAPYTLVCTCGWFHNYSRWSKNFDLLHRCRCPRCRGSKFTVKDNLTGKIVRDSRSGVTVRPLVR